MFFNLMIIERNIQRLEKEGLFIGIDYCNRQRGTGIVLFAGAKHSQDGTNFVQTAQLWPNE